ncbi:MAG: methyltransferase domain-containing protein [Oscillospiraceae bacterium]|nr:methyltransferase domain-containing protein [Oscillospiraceae bacterium]
MSKYDFEIDLSSASSTGLILQCIKPGSVVLEFGCANGRMTRYMKEVLGCSVYIVEYDEAAFGQAMEYARDGICDDILTYSWMQKFAGISFDAVIFADVLEHLSAPSQVVEKAAAMMKNDGRMYVSLPNITHNDILLKLYSDSFDYTPTGILDDTHVYFRGMKNLPYLFENTGVYINTLQATYCPSGYTEQYNGRMPQGNMLLKNILNSRECGEIYQFVLTLSKQRTETEYLLKKPVLKSNIYLDTGSDFNANEVIPVECTLGDNGCYILKATVENNCSLKQVRFDPVENQGCIMRKISITQDGVPLTQLAYNGMLMDDGILFTDSDPMLIASCRPDGGNVEISAEILVAGESFITALCAENKSLSDSRQQLAAHILQAEQGIAHLNETVAMLSTDLDRRNKTNIALNQRNSQLENDKRTLAAKYKDVCRQNESDVAEINRLNGLVASLETDIGAYNMLVSSKEKYIMELEQELKSHIIYRLKCLLRELWVKAKPKIKKILKK